MRMTTSRSQSVFKTTSSLTYQIGSHITMKAYLFALALLALVVVSTYAAPSASNEEGDEEYNKFTNFLKCMGPHWAKDCGVKTLKCAVVRNPLNCIMAIICGGKDVHDCAKHHVHN